jgi:hypothetical protein
MSSLLAIQFLHLPKPADAFQLLGVLPLLALVWRGSLRTLSEMTEDLHDFRLRCRVSKLRLKSAETIVPRKNQRKNHKRRAPKRGSRSR